MRVTLLAVIFSGFQSFGFSQVLTHRISHHVIDSGGIQYQNLELTLYSRNRMVLGDSQKVKVTSATVPFLYLPLDTVYEQNGYYYHVYSDIVLLHYLDDFSVTYSCSACPNNFQNVLSQDYRSLSDMMYFPYYGKNESSFRFRREPIVYIPVGDSFHYNMGVHDVDSDELDFRMTKEHWLECQDKLDINTSVGEIIFKDFTDTGAYFFLQIITEEVFDPFSKSKQRHVFPLIVNVIDSIEFGQFTFYDEDGNEDWRRFRIVDPAEMQSIKFKYENQGADSINIHWLNNMFLADGETSFEKWRENSESFGEWKWQPDGASLYHYMIYPVVFEAEFWKNGHPYYQHLSYAIIRDTISGIDELHDEALLELANKALINKSTEAGTLRLYEIDSGKLLYEGRLLPEQSLNLHRYADRPLSAIFTTPDRKYQVLKVLVR